MKEEIKGLDVDDTLFNLITDSAGDDWQAYTLQLTFKAKWDEEKRKYFLKDAVLAVKSIETVDGRDITDGALCGSERSTKIC